MRLAPFGHDPAHPSTHGTHMGHGRIYDGLAHIVFGGGLRPPTSRVARRLIHPVVSPAMEDNPVHLLEPMVREAGFEQVRSGDVRPWLRYVQAVKPANAP